MIDPGPPKRVIAKVCIPDGEGGEICAQAREPFSETGRAWVDCRTRARKLAEAARAGEEGVVICARCETNVVVQYEREALLCDDCRGEAGDGREPNRIHETDQDSFDGY